MTEAASGHMPAGSPCRKQVLTHAGNVLNTPDVGIPEIVRVRSRGASGAHGAGARLRPSPVPRQCGVSGLRVPPDTFLRTPCATGYVRWDGTGDRKGPAGRMRPLRSPRSHRTLDVAAGSGGGGAGTGPARRRPEPGPAQDA